MKLLKNLVVAFVVLFFLTFLWHNVILADFYSTNLSQIGRYTDGVLTPLLGYLALGNILAALGFALFIPAISKTMMDYLLYGFVMGLSVTGAFALFSYGIFENWTANLAFADFSYGIISGALTGLALSFLNKKSA